MRKSGITMTVIRPSKTSLIDLTLFPSSKERKAELYIFNQLRYLTLSTFSNCSMAAPVR
jgi:hypothetical protein